MILWDVTTGEPLVRFEGHTKAMRVAFAPDGKRALSASWDGTIREWEIPHRSPEELLAWVRENRYVRDFTCDERAQYRIEPPCE